MPDRRVYAQTSPGATTWQNISGWVDWSVQEAPRGDMQPSTAQMFILSFHHKTLAPLPVQITGGTEIIYYTHNAPGTHEYHVFGIPASIEEAPLPGGEGIIVSLMGVDHDELNAHVPFVGYDPAVYRYDKDRIAHLLESSGLPDKAWDAHTYVAGPFVDYLGTGVQGFYRTNLWDIMQTWAGATPTIYPNTANRRWYVGGKWNDEANPGAAGNYIVRVLHYYSNYEGPQQAKPFTDKNSGIANYSSDNFTAAGRRTINALDIGPTGQQWIEVNSSRFVIDNSVTPNTAMMTIGGSGGPSLVYHDSGIADNCDVQMKWAVAQDDSRMAWRIAIGGTGGWSGFFIQHSSGSWQVQRFSGGAGSVLGSYVGAHANGDVVRVHLAGNVHQVYINGVLRITITDALNNTSSLVGISANSTGAGRFDDFTVYGKGAIYYAWKRKRDYSRVVNIVPISGPGADPVSEDWENMVRTDGGPGHLFKKEDVAVWQASHAYALNEVVRPLANPNGMHYKVTTAGTTIASEPNWNTALTEGSTVTNGTVTFTNITWDASATGKSIITEDGGYVRTVLEQNIKASDTFSGAETLNTLGVAESGQPWVLFNGAYSRGQGIATCTTPGTVAVDSGVGSAAIVEAVFVTALSGQRLMVRGKDFSNMIFALCNGAGNATIVKRVAGVDTTLFTAAVPINTGDTVKVVLNGSTMSLYTNGTWRGDAIDTFQMGATLHGLGSTVANAKWDNFKVWQSYTDKLIGLDFGTTPTFNGIDHGIHVRANRTLQAIESGVYRGASTSYGAGDAIQVEARKIVIPGNTNPVMVVRMYHQPLGSSTMNLLYESAIHPAPTQAVPLRVAAVLYHVGAEFTSVSTRRFTYAVYSDPVSIGLYGRRWNKEMVTGDELDTNDKRQAFATGVFARYGYPLDTFQAVTREKVYQGRRILVNNARLGWVDQLRVVSEVTVDQAKLRNRNVSEYTFIAGDAPYEYGDDEQLGYILRAPDTDTQAPPVPTGLQPTTGARTGRFTVSQDVAWDRMYRDERWVEVEWWLVSNPQQIYVDRWSATWQHGTLPDLIPNTTYGMHIMARDAHNNASEWTAVVEFTSIDVLRPAKVQWAVPAIPEAGGDGTGTTWARIDWLPVTPPPVIGSYVVSVNYVPNPPRSPFLYTVPADQDTYVVANMAPRNHYLARVAALDTWGLQGDWSDPLDITIAPNPVRNPDTGFDTGGSVDAAISNWFDQPTAKVGTSTVAVSNAQTYKGKASLAITNAVSSTTEMWGLPMSVVAGNAYFFAIAMRRALVGDNAKGTYLLRWFDRTDVQVGADDIIANVVPSNTQFDLNTATRIAPAGAAYVMPVLKVATSGTESGTVYFSPPVQQDSITVPMLNLITDVSNPWVLYDSTGIPRLQAYVSSTSVAMRVMSHLGDTFGLDISTPIGDQINLFQTGGINIQSSYDMTLSSANFSVTATGLFTLNADGGFNFSAGVGGSAGSFTLDTSTGDLTFTAGGLLAFNVGAGLTVSGYATFTDAWSGNGGHNTLLLDTTHTGTATTTGQGVVGGKVSLRINTASATTTKNAWGYRADVTVLNTSQGAMDNMYGFYTILTHNSPTGTPITYALMAAYYARVSVFGAAVATNAYGMKIDAPTFSGTATMGTYYGIRIETAINATKIGTSYALYTAGGTVYHATGAVGTIGLIVDGAASQTAVLQDWRVAGTSVASVSNVGQIATTSSFLMYSGSTLTADFVSTIPSVGNGRGILRAYQAGSALEAMRFEGPSVGGVRLSFFGVGAVAQQTGGALTAGATYTATEQGMLNSIWTALRNYGLLT